MSEHRSRRWPLRLVQLSPLIAIALLAVVWFSIPMTVAMTLAGTGWLPGASITPLIRTGWLDNITEYERGTALGLTGPGPSLQSAAEASWVSWLDGLGSDVSTAAVFAAPPLSSDATAFAPLAEWERTRGARVWAWVVPEPALPQLVASATGDPASYSMALLNSHAVGIDGQPRTSGLLDWLWSNQHDPSVAVPALTLGRLQVGARGSMGSDDWMLSEYTLTGGGKPYAAYILHTPEPGPAQEPPGSAELPTLDPTAPDFQQRIAAIAASGGVNIWVLGPEEMKAIPLRLPEGATADEAALVGAAIWPSMAIQPPTSAASSVRPVPEQVAAVAGGPFASIQVTGLENTQYFSGLPIQFGPQEIPPQTVAFLAVWRDVPAAPTAAQAAWSRWQRFVAGWFPFLLGGAVAFLGLTLVASPAAFVYERRLIARERVREEMARMRRDVHDKVYNRLSALSKRVAASGDELAVQNAAALSAIAEDIRVTVGDLQEILGDEVRHTNSALTSVPLAEQIASVCAAQGARLGIAIDCGADEGLPEADARLGWDLQCIAEEAITNAVRHGAATHVRVRLTLVDGVLELSVADNGSGSAVASAVDAPEGSTGLRGITERLARHGGELLISAGEDGGMVLVARVPLGTV
jgi:signal transduction histidine kinase